MEVRKEAVSNIAKQALAIVCVAYALILLLVYAVPHLPLADRRTFYPMLKAQMTVDRAAEGVGKHLLLFLGSSVVERGVAELYMDSLLEAHGESTLETANSGTGGFFAKANLPMFRTLLERGLKPKYVVYGFFLQEFNKNSAVHVNVSDQDTSDLKLKEKTFWNAALYGPKALFPLTQPDDLHKYVFVANNAFREVHDLSLLDKLMFGQNGFERDSSYKLDTNQVRDMEQIVELCKERGIPLAFYNTPVRPYDAGSADLPYAHRSENYEQMLRICKRYGCPIWNFDRPGLFAATDFQDPYHLTPNGARHITALLESKVIAWKKGAIEQDDVSTLF
jgi:hypothetical protein